MKAEQIQKAITEDKDILAMQEIRKSILTSAAPTYRLNEEGFVHIMGESTKLQLTLIDKAILSRIEQITNFYNR